MKLFLALLLTQDLKERFFFGEMCVIESIVKEVKRKERVHMTPLH